ncbi:hypothetical protein PG994_008125 [Apiospora phragmitis]|uniref:Uncharacterized protein n=1 Tax=Apiospora phragmitis TaxID=2905665 RepID=A0ABR1UV93_9PEZI
MPPRHDEAPGEEEAPTKKHAVRGKYLSPIEEDPGGEKAPPRKEDIDGGEQLTREEGLSRREDSQHGNAPPRRDEPAHQGEALRLLEALLGKKPPRKAEPPREEASPREAPHAVETSTQPRKSPWRDPTPHSQAVARAENPRDLTFIRLEPSFGGAVCGAAMDLVLRLVLRRCNSGEGEPQGGQMTPAAVQVGCVLEEFGIEQPCKNSGGRLW